MKKLVLSTLLVLCASIASLTMAGADQLKGAAPDPVIFVSGCGSDVMFTYDVPRNNYDTIVFARTFDIMTGQTQVDDTKAMKTSGAEICLPKGTGNVHRLRLGDGVEVDLPSQQAVTALVRFLEDEALAEAVRVMDAYDIPHDTTLASN